MEIMCLHWLAKRSRKGMSHLFLCISNSFDLEDRFFVHEIDTLFKLVFGHYPSRPSFYAIYETRVAGYSKCDFHSQITPEHLKGEMCSYDKGSFFCSPSSSLAGFGSPRFLSWPPSIPPPSVRLQPSRQI